MRNVCVFFTLVFILLPFSMVFADAGDILDSPEEGWIRVENEDERFVYSTDRNLYNGGNLSGGNASQMRHDDTVSFHFNGSSIRIIGVLSIMDYGTISIRIDGEKYYLHTDFEEFGYTEGAYEAVLFEKTDLSPGEHFAVIHYENWFRGYVFLFDAIDVLDVDTEPPPAPANLNVTSDVGQINLNWDDMPIEVNDLLGYHVYVNGSRITNTPLSESNFIYNPPENGVYYSIYVTAIDTNGNESVKSESVQAVSYPPLEYPVLSSEGVMDENLRLRWTDVGTSYQVFKDGSKIKDTVYPFVDVTGLDANTSYEFYVVSYDKYGRLAQSNVLTVTTKPPQLDEPVLSFEDIAHDSFKVVWDQQDDADNYDLYLDDVLLGSFTDQYSYLVSGLNSEKIYSVRLVVQNEFDSKEAVRSVTTLAEPVPKVISASVSNVPEDATKKTVSYRTNELVDYVEILVDGVSVGVYPVDGSSVELDFSSIQDKITADVEINPVDSLGNEIPEAEGYRMDVPVKSTGMDQVDSFLSRFLNINLTLKQVFLYLAISAIPLTIIVILFFWLRHKFRGLFGKYKNFKGQAKDSKTAIKKQAYRNKYVPQKINQNPMDMKGRSRRYVRQKREQRRYETWKKGMVDFKVVGRRKVVKPLGFLGSQGTKVYYKNIYERDGVRYERQYVKGKGVAFVPRTFEDKIKHTQNNFRRVREVFTSKKKRFK